MLTDAQVDRYSRQIILPEVGGRGQARLLAARVVLTGTTAAAAAAGTYLARAGVGDLALVGGTPAPDGPSPDCRVRRVATIPPDVDVIVDLGDGAPAAHVPAVVGRGGGMRAIVALVVGGPCGECLPAETLAVDPSPLTGPTALALGALAATEALRALLLRPAVGRLHGLDLGDGTSHATPLAATAGCARCGGAA
jgi:adenylyltransferase/sulfurtransferase